MSKQDLEEYWTRRDGVSKSLGNKDILSDPLALQEFLHHKEGIEKELKAKDPRATRALRYAAFICMQEGEALANVIYPDPRTRLPLAEVKLVMKSEKKLTFQLYDILGEMGLAAVDEVAP